MSETRHPTMSDDGMNFHTRKWIRPEDLNANGTLFGGSLLRWIDEEAAIYAIIQLGNHRVVTKLISEIEFQASALQGDLVEMGLLATDFGRTSLTMRAVVRNMITRRVILTIDRIVFVASVLTAGRRHTGSRRSPIAATGCPPNIRRPGRCGCRHPDVDAS